MAFKLSTTADAAINGIKVLVYGGAGIGKTRLVATTPDPILISAESGLLSLRGHNIPVIEIATLDELKEIYGWITGSEESKKYKTVCLDSLTEIGEAILANAKETCVTKAGKADGLAAYRELGERVTEAVKAFRDLRGKNVYFSAQEEKSKDENGVSFVGPKMPGSKTAQSLPYWFDEVFHMAIGTTPEGLKYRYLRTAPDGMHDAKDRSGALDEIEEPDLSKIFDKIIAGGKKK